ncbi:leucyl/phenylalanyl-tRNA--protein transferase [Brevundimonas sp.]|uniref:leucyl/phenylalanyl-tRNA--protein transferase n=1 Tax=Brevundimonas sp. TaxID=1871086 RepID=UPI0035B281BE
MAFGPDDLLACYASGVFPMGEGRDDPRVYLVEPEMRGIIPLDGLKVSSRLARTIRQDRLDIRCDTAFDAVVAACAEAGAGDRADTWINTPIRRLYGDLFRRGHAHSVECWDHERLVGGLYGVSLGGAFFGESMFSRARDASKITLVHLVARLRRGGWRLLDAQFQTDHLASLGAVEISQADYLARLKVALEAEGNETVFRTTLSGAEAVDSVR